MRIRVARTAVGAAHGVAGPRVPARAQTYKTRCFLESMASAP
jgi:hypothetical protein